MKLPFLLYSIQRFVENYLAVRSIKYAFEIQTLKFAILEIFGILYVDLTEVVLEFSGILAYFSNIVEKYQNSWIYDQVQFTLRLNTLTY